MNAPIPHRRFDPRHPGKLFIGGEWRASAGSETLTVINPATEEVVTRVAAATSDDVELALARAHDAFHRGPWPRLTPAERAAYVRRIGAAVRARISDFANAVTLEMGATFLGAAAGAEGAAGLFDYYADMAEQLAEAEERPWAGGRAYVAHRPVGVVAAIVPWNAPLSLSILKLAPALAAGCAIILKPAPTTPLDAILLAECVEEAGLPPGVVSILPGGNDAGDMLVRDARVDKVTFTGSTAVGRHIGAICGGRIARQALELGGKSAAILLDDMDAGTAAAKVVASSMLLTGQACSALTRILVPQRRHDDVAEALVAAFGQIRPGDPYDPATTIGPLAIERQRDRVESYIAAGKDEGAKLAIGGGRPAIDRGYFLDATLFCNVRNDMLIAREEIFGPVVSLIPYADEEEAIAIANDSEYGLYASVFTNDEDAFWRIAPRLRSGNVSRSGLFIDRKLPYGGFKQSGIAREGGVEGLRSFQELQTLFLPG